jgi:chemotaxis protein CheY-P-specific phosphatase CheC
MQTTLTLPDLNLLSRSVERDLDATRRKAIELNAFKSDFSMQMRASLLADQKDAEKLAEDLAILNAKIITMRREMLEEPPNTTQAAPPSQNAEEDSDEVNAGSGASQE